MFWDRDFEEWLRRTRRFFEEMDRTMDQMFRDAFKEVKEGRMRRIGPYVYGFSVTVGPNGVPKIREWGNMRPGTISPRISETMEPYSDIIDEKDYIKVMVDLPGVERDDIKLEAIEDMLTVSARRDERSYYKEIALPCKVKPESARAKYKNGVLTVTLEKAEAEKRRGVNVKVE